MNNTTKRTRRKKESGKGYFVLGGAILCGTAAMVFLGRLEVTWPAVAALLAGPALGIWLFRFGSRHAWVTLVCLFGALAVCAVLLADVAAFGSAGVAWMGGLVGGSNIGAAWRTIAVARKAPQQKQAWTVDGRGYSSGAQARRAAESALRALDGKNRWQLAVEYGPSRFEVAGAPEPGFVCHRSANTADHRSWAVLVNPGPPETQALVVPMGRAKGTIPSKLVLDLDSAAAAMSGFFNAPRSAPSGREWESGAEAEGTRLAAG